MSDQDREKLVKGTEDAEESGEDVDAHVKGGRDADVRGGRDADVRGGRDASDEGGDDVEAHVKASR